MPERIRQCLRVPATGNVQEEVIRIDGGFEHATVLVSVVLGTNRHKRQWTHAIEHFALVCQLDPVDVTGDKFTFRVSGTRHGIRRLARLTNVVDVDYRPAGHGPREKDYDPPAPRIGPANVPDNQNWLPPWNQ